MKQYDAIVVGAGAAGLIAAAAAAGRGRKTLLIEKNAAPGRKLMITGKGRCNLTNNCTVEEFLKNIPVNPRFLYSAVSGFSPADTIAYFEALGVALKTERGRRVFPQSDRAGDVVAALVENAQSAGAEFIRANTDKLLTENGVCLGVSANGQEYRGSVVAATGGISYPQTGSTGDGYAFAKSAGHTIVKPSPSLVPIVTAEDFSSLTGLTLKNVTLSVRNKDSGKVIFSELGEMLFTHFGISGPLALSASAHMHGIENGGYRLFIDLKPGLTLQQLDLRLQRDFAQRQNSNLGNIMPALLPRALVTPVLRTAGISAELKSNSVTREQRRQLGEIVKAFPLTPSAFRPVEEAIITSGGVNVKEINPKTMESKLVKGLFFAGEVIDVDGYTGGYNLQIAFSTGYAAGMSI